VNENPDATICLPSSEIDTNCPITDIKFFPGGTDEFDTSGGFWTLIDFDTNMFVGFSK